MIAQPNGPVVMAASTNMNEAAAVSSMSSVRPAPAVAIDLFAGGGGLTEGLRIAGFVVCAAVETDAAACDTYSANHPGTVLFRRDIKSVSADELRSTSPTSRVELIAACPPCQGFSSLTSKYKRTDPRNELIFDFVRLALAIRPAMVMMENVPGLAGKGAGTLEAAMSQLRAAGYALTSAVVDVADFGIAQNRKRLVVLGSLNGEIAIPKPTHSRDGSDSTERWMTVRDAIHGMSRPTTLLASHKQGGPQGHNWHVVRSMSSANVERLRFSRPGQSRSDIPKFLRPKCHRATDTGFSNVYGRMAWTKPSPTITGGCTTLSKGRFGHPSQLRTISVREAALLQSFPESYKFATDHMDKACSIVGNALPPRFAAAMAAACMRKMLRGDENGSEGVSA
jgi:DNA (cytosine-5)-methyltransferase 1